MQENTENNCCTQKIIDFVKELEKTYKQEKDNLISMLEEVQEKFGFIPLEAQKELSEYLKIPMAEIYGVITFH